MPIRTLYASSIGTKSHQILSMTLLTSNNQILIIDKTMSMVQWDTVNARDIQIVAARQNIWLSRNLVKLKI